MTPWLLWGVTAAYAVQSVLFVYEGKMALALVLGGYTIANIGLIIGAIR